MLIEKRPNYFLSFYSQMANCLSFPAVWKKAKLVLLREGIKPIEYSSSYTHICLLDVVGKLYKHLLLGRLHSELQCGRRGRKTVDAINRFLLALLVVLKNIHTLILGYML